MSVFCLDPGHGGTDPGTVNGKRKEKDDVLKLALKVKPLLEEQGHTVVMTRSTDKDITIAKRCSLANKKKCDYFLSIHRNSGGDDATGLEAWVHSQAYEKTVNQAEEILSRCCQVYGEDRGVKKGAVSYTDYGVNTGTTMPSALLEMLFISNDEDNTAFNKNMDAYALAIAKGLVAAVDGKWKETTKPEETGGLYRVQVGAFSVKANAEALVKELKGKGYQAFVAEGE